MKRSVAYSMLLAIFLVAALGTIGLAQSSRDRAYDTAKLFLENLRPCVLEYGEPQPVENPCFPAGCYCMYYRDDPEWPPNEIHGFGWYPCKQRCSALYQLVEEPTRDCCFNNVVYHAPHEVLPSSSYGIVFQIPATHAPAGFYLNNPYGRQGIQGLYYTETSRNTDGLRHAYIFKVDFKPGKCDCRCNQRPTQPIDNVLYILVWEDGCGGYDNDWNDFVAALIPVTCPCR